MRNAKAKEMNNTKRLVIVLTAVFVGLAIIFGAVLGIILGVLITPALYSLSVVGVLITIVCIFSSKKSFSKQNELSADEFIEKIYGRKIEFNSKTEAFYKVKSDLESHKRALAEYEDEMRTREIRLAAASEKELMAKKFVSRFAFTGHGTLPQSLEEILKKFRRYEFLCEYEKKGEQSRRSQIEDIEIKRTELKEFLSHFPTVSRDPLNEIRNNLAEYEALSASLISRKESAARFARLHEIESLDEEETITEQNGLVCDDIEEVNAQIIAAEREHSRLVADYDSAIRETEKIDELYEKLNEKQDKVRIYSENLEIINKTKVLLAKSRDNMTARYLEATKREFEKYVSIIDKDGADFTMDTSFVVSKTDLGKTRPAEAYSRGTRDMHSLAVRLALSHALFDGDLPPLILDDPFVSFDDTHTVKATAALKRIAENRQIFYFTASKSRKI